MKSPNRLQYRGPRIPWTKGYSGQPVWFTIHARTTINTYLTTRIVIFSFCLCVFVPTARSMAGNNYFQDKETVCTVHSSSQVSLVNQVDTAVMYFVFFNSCWLREERELEKRKEISLLSSSKSKNQTGSEFFIITYFVYVVIRQLEQNYWLRVRIFVQFIFPDRFVAVTLSFSVATKNLNASMDSECVHASRRRNDKAERATAKREHKIVDTHFEPIHRKFISAHPVVTKYKSCPNTAEL